MIRRKNLLTALGVTALLGAITSTSAMAADVTLKLHQFLPAQANVPKLVLDVWQIMSKLRQKEKLK